jgi:hypothetical protein
MVWSRDGEDDATRLHCKDQMPDRPFAVATELDDVKEYARGLDDHESSGRPYPCFGTIANDSHPRERASRDVLVGLFRRYTLFSRVCRIVDLSLPFVRMVW